MTTKMGTFLVAVAVIGGICNAALAERTIVDMGAADVAVRESSNESYGPYFLVDVDIPRGITVDNLMGAVLEFYLDVHIRVDNALLEAPDTSYTVVHRNPVPLLEVYALTSAAVQTLDPTQWNEALAFPTPTGLGTGRIVRIDITRLVTYCLENPEENHGLIVGSLTGKRPGHFSLQESFGAGVRARIRYTFDQFKF